MSKRKRYTVFTRTWWRENPDYPEGLEPHLGRKKFLAGADTAEEARKIAQEWNRNNNPGRLSRKAEFTETINLR